MTNEKRELTDADFDNLWIRRMELHDGSLMPQLRDFARTAIAADRALNADAGMRQAPEGWKLAPIEPTLDQYNAACKAFCAWEVKCADEAREHRDESPTSWGYSQPHFTHSDAYKAMLAAAPTPEDSCEL